MATKKLVPRATNEGGLGTALKVWGASWLQNLTITNLQTSTSVNGLVENAGNVEKRNLTTIGIDVQDTEQASCFVGLWEEAVGTLLPKTDEMLTYNALTNILRVGSNTENTSYYSNTILAKGAPFNIRSTNDRISISAREELLIHSDANDINFSTGVTPVQVGHLSTLGLIINNLPAAVSPTKILVESTTVAGLVSHLAMSSIVPNLQTLDEGSSLTTTTQSINYVGSGVTTTHSGNATTVTIPGATNLAVQDTENAACFVGLYEAATGNLAPKTDEGLTYNALDGSELLTLVGNMDITGTGTTNNIVDIVNTTLTTGIALNVSVSGEKAGTNSNPLVNFDLDETVPDTVTNEMPVLRVDYRKTGATGSSTTSRKYGQRISVWDAASNNVGASMEQTGLYISSGFNSNVGSIKQTGIYLGVGSSNVGDSGLMTVGIDLNVLDAGYDIKMSSNTTNGWATMRTVADGAFELTTIDPLSDNADITLTADGETIFQKNSTGSTVVQATVESLRTESFMMACSDETTALTAGTNKVKFRMPYAFTVTEVRASLSTAGTGAQLVTVDINESGTSILSTKITIDATETTSVTAATAPVISDTSLADDAEMTVDIDLIDTGGVSKGLKVSIIGHKTV